jgi:hypothetical protein
MIARPAYYRTQLHECGSPKQQRLAMPFAALSATRWGCVVNQGNSGIRAKGGGLH